MSIVTARARLGGSCARLAARAGAPARAFGRPPAWSSRTINSTATERRRRGSTRYWARPDRELQVESVAEERRGLTRMFIPVHGALRADGGPSTTRIRLALAMSVRCMRSKHCSHCPVLSPYRVISKLQHRRYLAVTSSSRASRGVCRSRVVRRRPYPCGGPIAPLWATMPGTQPPCAGRAGCSGCFVRASWGLCGL